MAGLSVVMVRRNCRLSGRTIGPSDLVADPLDHTDQGDEIMGENIRYQLDAPARKIRAELGLDPLEPGPAGSLGERIRQAFGIIETDRELTPEEMEQLRKEWRDRMSRPHGIAILTGAKFTTSTGPR